MTRPNSPASRSIPSHSASALDLLFPRICRATAQEARELSMSLTLSERANLALSCNGRAHLRAQGRAIAGACTMESLVEEGGYAGLVLFNQVEAGSETWGTTPPKERRRISLAG